MLAKRPGFSVVSLLLIVLYAALSLQFIASAWQRWQARPTASTTNTTSSESVDFAAQQPLLSGWFGSAQPAGSQSLAAPTGFRLKGLVHHAEQALSYAIIASTDGRELLVRVGESLPDGSRLERIDAEAMEVKDATGVRRIALSERP